MRFEHPEFVPLDGVDTTFPDGAAPASVEALSYFDTAFGALLDSCAEYAVEPTEQNRTNIGLNSSVTFDTLVTTLEEMMATDGNLQERVTGVARVILGADTAYISLFKRLGIRDQFFYLASNDKKTRRYIKRMYEMALESETTEVFLDWTTDSFREDLQANLNHFMFLCQKKSVQLETEEQNNTRPSATVDSDSVAKTAEDIIDDQQRMTKTAGKHVLDVVKLSAGVALGIWLGRRSSRH